MDKSYNNHEQSAIRSERAASLLKAKQPYGGSASTINYIAGLQMSTEQHRLDLRMRTQGTAGIRNAVRKHDQNRRHGTSSDRNARSMRLVPKSRLTEDGRPTLSHYLRPKLFRRRSSMVTVIESWFEVDLGTRGYEEYVVRTYILQDLILVSVCRRIGVPPSPCKYEKRFSIRQIVRLNVQPPPLLTIITAITYFTAAIYAGPLSTVHARSSTALSCAPFSRQ